MYYILGIETSCDDTALGLIKVNDDASIDILSNIVVNQNNFHEKYGGIVPEIAARAHLKVLPEVLKEILHKNHITMETINLISYTEKPGLLGSLLVGINFGKGLALAYNISIIGVNHLEAHLLVNFINKPLVFPCVGLIISGGHTELWRLHSLNNYEVLETTKDDAIGEFFDKLGRIMALPFPGGPFIEKLGMNQESIDVAIPKCLSFSGLKTKFIKLYRENKIKKEIICKTMEVTSGKLLIRTINNYIKPKETLVIGGGVSANSYIRNTLEKHYNCNFIDKKLCTDNGVMIAFTGYINWYYGTIL